MAKLTPLQHTLLSNLSLIDTNIILPMAPTNLAVTNMVCHVLQVTEPSLFDLLFSVVHGGRKAHSGRNDPTDTTWTYNATKGLDMKLRSREMTKDNWFFEKICRIPNGT